MMHSESIKGGGGAEWRGDRAVRLEWSEGGENGEQYDVDLRGHRENFGFLPEGIQSRGGA